VVTIYEKRKTAYVGIDMHKQTHTAAVLDCWLNVLGHITFPNRPNAFDSFVKDVKALCGDLTPVFGLEDTRGFGRNLALYLDGHKHIVKSVNPAYTSAVRLSAPTVYKDDEYDAVCIARILRDMIDTLPDAHQPDIFWTIRQFVKRRDSLSKRHVILQNQLHGQLMYGYPSYRQFFCAIDGKAALYFWEHYPSPEHLQKETAETLAANLRQASRNACSIRKAEQILSLVASDGEIKREHQIERDFITRSIVQELRHSAEQIKEVDAELSRLLPLTGYKLETMPGINLITAARLASEIGDIGRFPNADKLARFSGIAPVWFKSAGNGKEQRSRQGNRVLHGVFYFLAVQLIQVSKGGKPRHPVFHEYFNRKIKEGKIKSQALVCVMRRAVNIIYGMMKNKTAYVPYEKPAISSNAETEKQD
jgi:transposase